MELFSSLIGVLAIITLAVGVIGSLVCFILVLIQMFRRDQRTLGLVCIATSLLAGLGTIVAFIVGWLKATEWHVTRTMIVWTICQFLQMLGVVLMMFVLFDYAGDKLKEGLEKSRQAPRRRVEIRHTPLVPHPTPGPSFGILATTNWTHHSNPNPTRKRGTP